MSSYLNIYVKPKSLIPMELISFSRSNPIYSLFCDNMLVAYIDNENPYSLISLDDITRMNSQISEDIVTVNTRLQEYEKYAAQNTDLINSILELKEYLSELQMTKYYILFIQLMIEQSTDKEFYCNVD